MEVIAHLKVKTKMKRDNQIGFPYSHIHAQRTFLDLIPSFTSLLFTYENTYLRHTMSTVEHGIKTALDTRGENPTHNIFPHRERWEQGNTHNDIMM